jgi:hypothetical protein
MRPNALTSLLTKPTRARTVEDYETVYDDFVRFAGGARISQRFPVPRGHLNADYHFDLSNVEMIVELKQLNAFRRSKTVDDYFATRLREGRVKHFETLSNGKVRITPESLSVSDWNRFYKCFRPGVSNHLKMAARQLKVTDGFLPEASKRRVKGVAFVNTGDFNLSTDLLLRLVEWRMKREWRAGHFRSIDFVTCITTDMIHEGRHPLHGRHIARCSGDEVVRSAVEYLYDRWIYYGAAALGVDVTRVIGTDAEDIGRDMAPFRGKIAIVVERGQPKG